MRAALLLLAAAGVVSALPQVSYAPSTPERAGPGAGPGRRRRVRLGRRPRPDPQLAEDSAVVPLPVEPPSRPFSPLQPVSEPPQSLESFQPYQPEPGSSTYRPVEPRPAAGSSGSASAGGGRYRGQQEIEYADYDDYQPEKKDGLLDEFYEDEPDRLSILLQESSFYCDPAASGYFADDSVNCEVFHYCTAGVKHSWICPEGHTFHQINLICMPQGADNICERSADFHFVNDYLYQQINNDSLRPQYADRYYPDVSQQGSEASRPAPQASYTPRQPAPARRRVQPQRPQPQRPQPQQSQQFAGFQRPQRQPDDFSGFRAAAPPPQADFAQFAASDTSFQRRGDAQPLPPVRPPVDPYPQAALSPSINFRGAPRPAAQERNDDIVLGGFQGNVDIEELASRAGGQ